MTEDTDTKGAMTLDYLRTLLDPEKHKNQVQQTLNNLKERASVIMVNYDLTLDSPHTPKDVRDAELRNLREVGVDLAWRINRLEEDLRGLDMSSRRITGLNRTQRREVEKAAKKAAKKQKRDLPPDNAIQQPPQDASPPPLIDRDGEDDEVDSYASQQ